MRHHDRFFAEFALQARPGRFEPNCDVYLTDDHEALVVTVEIAGVDATELRVVVEERRLLIFGRRHETPPADRGQLLMKEIAYGDFGKKIHLPVAIAHDRAVANYHDGLLTIRLPVDADAHVPASRTEFRMTIRRVPA